jgi:transposase
MNRRISYAVRLASVKAYLADNKSLRDKAYELDVHYITLFRWVKRYRDGGEEALNNLHRTDFRRNRLSSKITEATVKLKEAKPYSTIHQARQSLNANGIIVSSTSIWRVWQEYGFCGFIKEKFANNFRLYIAKNSKLEFRAQTALKYLQNGNFKKAVKIVNSLPYCQLDKVLEKIPDKYLNLRRRVEKLPLIMRSEPYPQIRKKARVLRIRLEKGKLFYSALRAGVMELLTSGWIGDPEYQLLLAQHLERLLNVTNNSRFPDLGLLLTILIYKARAYAGLLKINEAIECARKCKKILKNRCAPNIKRTLSSLFATLGLNTDAYRLILEARSECTEDYERSNCDLLRAQYAAIAGNYRVACNVLKTRESLKTDWNASSYLLVKAECALGQGRPQKAQSYASLALEQSQKTGLRTNLHFSSLVCASAYMYLAEYKKAYSILTRFNSLFRKNNMKKYLTIRSLLSPEDSSRSINHESNLTADSQLVALLNNAQKSKKYHDYVKVYQYVQAHSIVGIFHQVVPFYAPLILKILGKCKSTKLPRTILRLPVFNKEPTVYYLKFLGHLVVNKNQRYLEVNLTPKDTAFLINFALKAGEPGKRISLKEIYRNFWRDSRNPSRNLSHLLVRIKKSINLPSHLLEFSYRKDNPYLVNRGIHFTTDYDEFKQTIAQAKALLRAGEWGFAKREFMRAFKLFRGEPFKKMYDNWSDDKRLEILFSYETEVKSFLRELVKRGRTKEAEKVIEKAVEIVPYLNENDMEI